MIFEFLFRAYKKKSDNDGFVEILHKQAEERNLKFAGRFAKIKEDNFYSFFLHSSPQEALEFADNISLTLPSSIYFNFIEIKTPENPNISKWLKVCKKSSDFLDVSTIKEILDKNSPRFCDIFQWTKNIQFLGKNIADIGMLQDTLKHIATRLKNGESIRIQTSRGLREFSYARKTEHLMFWEISNLFTYMRVDNVQSQVLASYEKPTMRLMPKEVFAPSLVENDGDFEIRVCLPFDLILSLLGIFALDLEMGYVFYKDIKNSDIDFSYKSPILPKEKDIVVSKDGLIIETEICKNSKTIFDIVNRHFEDETLQEEELSEKSSRFSKNTPPINHQKLIVFLSKIHPTKILVKDGKSLKALLPIEFDNNPKNILKTIKSNYKSGDKLISNFSEHFEDIFSALQSLPDTPMMTNNLIDIFSSSSFVLGYTSTFNARNQKILNNAKKFVRDKGPRIDFKLQKKDEGVFLDYPKILRSSMSFAIAGLDEATLSYGFVDSMAEFLGNFVRDATTNFSIKKVLVCGDILNEKIFLDKMLHYLPKNIDLILPKEGYIDYKS